MSMDHILPAAQQARADSPFIPGTTIQFAWDSVSLTSILSCPRQYQYRIIRGLVPRAPSYAIALVFGILFHKGLEEYHKACVTVDHDHALRHAITHVLSLPATATLPVDEDISNMAESLDEDDDGITLRNSKIRTRYYLIRAIVWYLEAYKDDPCETLLQPSGQPAVELSFRLALPITVADVPLLLCGHIDRAVRFNDNLYTSDYKTTKSITKQWQHTFDLSHQMSGYTTAGKIIFEQPVAGTLIDGVALQVGQIKLGRHFTYRNEGQIAEYLATLRYAGEQAVRHAETQDYPMNTSACYFCDYKEICRQPPSARERIIRTSWIEAPGWNPLQNR